MYYRQYRPQTFAELDNARIKETLGKSLLENNWAHAYLLIGTRGSGKTTTARLIAKTINCPNRKKGEEPCNKCESCRAIMESRSLDVIEIDAASNTGVDDIRDLREKVRLAPTSSKYKVYIIDEVHMLSNSAFNALLKTLEEPPEHVIFVLATTDPQKLPATITSRCLVYDFGKASPTEIRQGLDKIVKKEKLKVQQEVLVAVTIRANGSHRDAQKILEQLAMTSDNITIEHLDKLNDQFSSTIVQDLLRDLGDNNAKSAIKAIEEFTANNGKPKDLVVNLIAAFKDILLIKNGLIEGTPDIKLSTEVISSLIKDLLEASVLIKDSPVPQLPLELVIIKYTSQPNKDKTDENQTSIRRSVDDKPDDKKGRTSKSSDQPSVDPSDMSVENINARWPDILTAIKPYNHSLAGLLRSSKPKSLENGSLVLEVFYKFHKDKLSEQKNREILEKVISDIMGQEIKVKFVLPEKE